MSCTVIVGGQFGSEGKGKVTTLMATSSASPWVVRCGGPNSGHTTRLRDQDVIVRQLPSGIDNPDATLLVAAGCVVDETLLFSEADFLGVERDRLIIDPRAVLLEPGDRDAEVDAMSRLGSTGSGTGAALVRRMQRRPDVHLARDSDRLRDRARVEPVAPQLHRVLRDKGDVLIEGTQGFGLSLFHGEEYPYVTSRDTTAAAFASEVGLSPRHVDRVCVVVRTFPIRVGGNSGPLNNEIDWDTVRQLSGAPATFPELTSVTRKLRRVARFDTEMVVAACRYNGATELAVMGLDRLDYTNSEITHASQLSLAARRFLRELHVATNVPVNWIGTGFRTTDAISLLEMPDGVTLNHNVAQ